MKNGKMVEEVEKFSDEALKRYDFIKSIVLVGSVARGDFTEKSDTEVERFREVTLHPSSKLITRLPRATSFVFSPYWYPEPFFIRHRKLVD
ncbi:MAG: nucleotidyltransferase domain-containing protein [Euryarchaeota archaeon]|nr:nucleotidyltransferase domain-containing protein [Euryarchaeota archaeon]